MLLRDIRHDSFRLQIQSQEPVSLETIKGYLRVYHAQDDELIGQIITAAREWCEDYCNQSFISCQRQFILSAFPEDELILSYGSVRELISISYHDENDQTQTVDLNDVRYVPNGRIPIIDPKDQWPSARRALNSITITYLAGPIPNDDAEEGVLPTISGSLPAKVTQAIMLLCQHFYDNRTLFVSGSVNEVPIGIQSLLSPHTIDRFY